LLYLLALKLYQTEVPTCVATKLFFHRYNFIVVVPGKTPLFFLFSPPLSALSFVRVLWILGMYEIELTRPIFLLYLTECEQIYAFVTKVVYLILCDYTASNDLRFGLHAKNTH